MHVLFEPQSTPEAAWVHQMTVVFQGCNVQCNFLNCFQDRFSLKRISFRYLFLIVVEIEN
jgi:hypothetical protein